MASSSSSASIPSWKYDVFLSFRGEDTRKNFTDHLHEGLKRFGIKTFIDGQLRRGEQISSELLQAIEDSRFSIIIFSQNYASSSWCLDELTKILECVDKGKHMALPVFFEVDPSHVRHQRGSYEEAFKMHEEAHKNNMEKVMRWREALATASRYSGWDTRGRFQAEVINQIVNMILEEKPWKYDVFLSFRGEDTRRNFTDHLHEGLKRFGIKTFIDDQLRSGEQISSELLQAIEDSRFSIIIFSQNYASSSWCLDELTKILECVDKGKHTAFPVFCEVDSSHVRHQRGSYEEAFKKHEEAHKNNMEKVVKWREALTRISGYSGWDTGNKHQADVIKKIVDKIFNELPRNLSSSNKIGIDSHIKAVLSMLCIGSHDVRMIGIWGMAGIGKTTLAEAIYDEIHTQFDGYCLLSNVREKLQRNENLQIELLSKVLRENLKDTICNLGADSIRILLHSKKVLIILDDVNHIKQLEELAGDCNWFGPKSRIIITTRDKRLLIKKNVNAIYEVEELERDEALMLFHQHAFKDKPPVEDFNELCYRSLDYTKGNPLAIEILGSLLFKRTKKEWDCELKKLKKFPNKNIQGVLRISFDGLEDNVKDIFLDIACFFKEEKKDYISKILESCDLYPETGIPTLIEKALITSRFGYRLSMHDLIQEMGWEIVRQQSIEDPGKRSRLWLNEDVEDVLTTNRGTETIQVIVLDLSALEESLDFNVDAFTKMINLRVLIFHFMHIYNHNYFRVRRPPTPDKILLKGDFKFPNKNLRYLIWEGYPLKFLPSNFNPRKLFRLNMRFSWLEQLWKGNKSFGKLRHIDLSYSQDLIRTPDLSGSPELRKLKLEGCTSLVEVHPSIETLEKLEILNLKNCSKLEVIAESFRKLTSLERVDFNYCLELRKLPEDLRMRCIYLHLESCSKLEELPNSIGKLTHLCFLDFTGCSKLEELPNSFGKLTRLCSLDLTGCSKIKKLPDEMGDLQRFVKCVADGSGIQEIPLLTSLEYLSLESCNSGNLVLSSDMSSLCCLVDLDLSGNNFITLPSLTPLAQLLRLILEDCKSLRLLTKLPSSIETICARNCESLETFSHPPNSYVMSKSIEFEFNFSNCGRLLENEESSVNNLEAILGGIRIVPRSHFLRTDRRFNVVVAGSRIPEWFTHRSQGNSIIVHQLPPDFLALNCLKLAFCVVLPGNLSRWNSHHLWFGITSTKKIQQRMIGKCVSHLKFSFSCEEDYGKAPLVVKEYGIRLLYLPSEECDNGEESDTKEEIVEYDSVNATSFSPPPTFNQEPCCQTTITAFSGRLIIQLKIEVEGDNIYALEPTMTTSLTQDPNQSKNGDARSIADVKPRLAEVTSDKSKIWKLTEINEMSQCQSLRLSESMRITKISRLIYTNSGKGILALASNGIHLLWKWQRNDRNTSGKATASVPPQLWQPSSGILMTNDVADTNPEEAVPCFALSKNGSYVMSASGGRISVFNMMTFKTLTTFMPPPPAATFLAFHPQDNNIIAIGMDDSTIQIYNVRLDEVKSKLKGHSKRITGLAFSHILDVLVSSGADSQLCVWDSDGWEKQKSKFLPIPPGRTSTGQSDTHVQFHQDQTHFLVVHETQLAIYETTKLDCVKQWVAREAAAPISHATFSCDSQLVYASFLDGTICVFSAANFRLRCRINPTAYLPASVSNSNVHPLVIAAHPQEPNQFALGLSDGGVYVFEPVESEGKWGQPPPVENGSASSMPATPSVGPSGPHQPQR